LIDKLNPYFYGVTHNKEHLKSDDIDTLDDSSIRFYEDFKNSSKHIQNRKDKNENKNVDGEYCITYNPHYSNILLISEIFPFYNVDNAQIMEQLKIRFDQESHNNINNVRTIVVHIGQHLRDLQEMKHLYMEDVFCFLLNLFTIHHNIPLHRNVFSTSYYFNFLICITMQ